ncbi:MAG: DUF6384 family protein [Trueperaceae bacterium]|nr:DUF6384 family protein [Trueperaceae bacterium]
MTTPAPSASAPAAPAGAPPLDDVMLAMDVVDTLRHQEVLVERELATGETDTALLERLRRVYAAQGIDVPDRILADGVAALREGRFTYAPPADSWQVRLARAYVQRGRYGRALLVVLAVVAIAVVAYRATVVVPRETLAADVDRLQAQVVALARVPEAVTRAEAAAAAARAALADGDLAEARAAFDDLEALATQLQEAFTLEIVARPNETTGVWRIPDVNEAARNYYLIVEAIDPDGRVLQREVRSEETGATSLVRRWGLRVDEATFERVAADKLDDGILQDRVFGEKVAGELDVAYRFPTTGGAITSW